MSRRRCSISIRKRVNGPNKKQNKTSIYLSPQRKELKYDRVLSYEEALKKFFENLKKDMRDLESINILYPLNG